MAVALMTVGGICAYAQNAASGSDSVSKSDSIELHFYNKYYSDWSDNWSVELLGSARVLMAEEDSHLGFGKRIKPSFQFSATKDMSPDVSLRATFAMGALKGWNTGSDGIYKWQSGWESADPVAQYLGIGKGVGYEQNLRYFTVGVDLMLNLWNLWTANNQINRRWTPYIFGGVEYFQLMKYKGYYRTYKIGGHVGLKCDYRLTNRVALTGEAAVAIHNATFDNEIGKGHRIDAYSYASLGVKVRLGHQGFRRDRVLPTGEYLRLGNVVTAINQQYELPNNQTAILGNLFAPSVVFDDNAETYSEELQMANISRMAQYMKDNPELKVSVIGNTHVVGANLAQRRADIVRKVLMERYNIDGSRLVSTTLDVNREYSVKGGDQAVNFGVTK